MATKKILYFIQDTVPTTDEQTQIDYLNALAVQDYSVSVRSVLQESSYGSGIEECDYTAYDVDNESASIPSAYSSVDAFGRVDADRPISFDVITDDGGAATVVEAATITLLSIATVGTTLDDLTPAVVTSAWDSDDDETALVGAATGIVTGVAAGTTNINATYTYETGETVVASIEVTVTAA